MIENLMISNSKLRSDSKLIWSRWSSNLSSFVKDNHAWCVLMGRLTRYFSKGPQPQCHKKLLSRCIKLMGFSCFNLDQNLHQILLLLLYIKCTPRWSSTAIQFAGQVNLSSTMPVPYLTDPCVDRLMPQQVAGGIGPWEIQMWYQINHFQIHVKGRSLEHFLWNCPKGSASRPRLWLVNISSGNGLVPSGNKSLPKPMLTHFYVAIWCQQATMN